VQLGRVHPHRVVRLAGRSVDPVPPLALRLSDRLVDRHVELVEAIPVRAVTRAAPSCPTCPGEATWPSPRSRSTEALGPIGVQILKRRAATYSKFTS